MNGEFPYNEKTPEMEVFKRAAFGVLRDNEGCDCQDGGQNVNKVESGVRLRYQYEDPDTGICFTFRDWAEYFANWEQREVYAKLVEVSRKLKSIKDTVL